MPPRRRTPVEAGRAALLAWRAATVDPSADAGARVTDATAVDRQTLATAVRYTLDELATVAPGRTVEVRVPPFGAVQCIEGPVHRRGTPPNVIETDADTWLRLAVGELAWAEAVGAARVNARGERAHLDGLLPLGSLTLSS